MEICCQKAVRNKYARELKEEIERSKKLKISPLINEKFKRKEYLSDLSLSDVRIKFKLRSQMFDVKMNYKSDPRHSDKLWQCDSCQTGQIESQDHILYCPAYAELRVNKDIKSDKDLIDYMRDVLKVREKLALNK